MSLLDSSAHLLLHAEHLADRVPKSLLRAQICRSGGSEFAVPVARAIFGWPNSVADGAGVKADAAAADPSSTVLRTIRVIVSLSAPRTLLPRTCIASDHSTGFTVCTRLYHTLYHQAGRDL